VTVIRQRPAILIIDFRAGQILQTQHVDQHLNAALLDGDVVFLPRVVELKAVLKPRTPAAADEHPQLQPRLALVGKQRMNALNRTRGNRQISLHGKTP